MSGQNAVTNPEAFAPPQDDDARRKLMQESGRNLNYIGEARLMAVIAASVRHAVKRTFGAVDETQLVKTAATAQRGFIHLLKNNGKAVRGLPVSDFVKEVEASRQQILRQREQARIELVRLTRELGTRREAMKTERVQFIAAKQEAGAELDEKLIDQITELFAGLGDVPGLDEIKRAITQITLQGVHEERQKAVQAKLAEHDAEVGNYERRIRKLTESLGRTEEEIKRLAKMKGVDNGVASIYRAVQGLSGADESLEQKQEMMTSIFEANLALQEKIDG